jgi:SAM-dependent methyltransferase
MQREAWDGADRYERYMGRWSRQVAPRFLNWLDEPHRQRWVDVACGTGSLTKTVLEIADPVSVVGIDQSAAYLDFARRSIIDARADFKVGDASALPVEDSVADVVVSGLALHFASDPSAAVKEMCRATGPGGRVASYVWDYADGMEFIRLFWLAAAAVDASAAELDQGTRFPLCAPDALHRLHAAIGMIDVTTEGLQIPTVFEDLDDLWLPFLGGQGATGRYCTQLDAPHLERIRDELAVRLPIRSDGSIALTARAWAVKATVPR